MSIHAQVAFGKNLTLQKQLEDKFLNLRRMFKHSRRRLDTFEEESVAALYKLLLYAREKQGLTSSSDVNIFNDFFQKSKSARARSQSALEISRADERSEFSRRPATAMSAKTYKQSYSFTKDGLNIDKSRRDRYMRTKADKERQRENNIKIERMKDDLKNFGIERPMTAIDKIDHLADDDENEKAELPMRPKTALPQSSQKGLLSRPRLKNTFAPAQISTIIQRSSTPLTVTENRTQHQFAGTNVEEVDSEVEHNRIDTPTQGVKLEFPCLKTVHESRTSLDGAKSPLVVRITTTRLNDSADHSKYAEKLTHFRTESRLDDTTDEELMSLNEDDKNQLNELVNSSHSKESRVHDRPKTASVLESSRNASTPKGKSILDGSLLRKSTEKTQTFLTQYSKKSRVFGYVVKTRSSIVAPRERLVSHRSPCITYQELASIKASLKQHESRTRSLVQRSAKLSTYVDKLARAGDFRQRLIEMKENKGNE